MTNINTEKMSHMGALLAQTGCGGMKAESLMLQMQMLVAKDFDEQMRSVGDQIQFLSKIKQSYRDHIGNIQNFMAQNPNSSRNDGKKFIAANFSQMAELTGNLVSYDYDLEKKTSAPAPMTLNDTGQHDTLSEAVPDDKVAVPKKDGKFKTTDLHAYFAQGATLTDKDAACDYAKKVGDDDGNLPFYFGHTGNTDKNGMPIFCAFTDALDKMAEEIKNKLSLVEDDAEHLSTSLNQLSAQRKEALEKAGELANKMDQVRSNTIAKIQ